MSRDNVITQMGKLQDYINRTKNLALTHTVNGELKPQINKYGNPSFQYDWNVENCAEVWTVRKSIMNGANFHDIVFKCVRTDTGDYAPACKNCEKTTVGFENLGESQKEAKRKAAAEAKEIQEANNPKKKGKKK